MVCTSWCMPPFLVTLNMRFMHILTKERHLPMKKSCKCALRDYLTKCLVDTRKREKLTQARFSEKLMMDTRSYSSLEHGESLCCTLTFILYLCFFCTDVDVLISDLREIVLKVQNDECHVS